MRFSSALATSCALFLAACGAEPAITPVLEDEGALGPGLTHAIDPARELLITDPSVVDDPERTVYAPQGRRGAWTFGRLIENLAGRRDASEVVLELFARWETDQIVNGRGAPARPAIRSVLVDPWRIASGCSPDASPCRLDFSRAPFRLTAIVSRVDKRPIPDGNHRVEHAGEGRFVFDVLGPTGNAASFTVIFEYLLPARTSDDILAWARRWHALGARPFGDRYNRELESLTDDFAGRGASLRFFRTNEVTLAPAGSDPTNLPSAKLWELRSFGWSAEGGFVPLPVAQTPALALAGTPELGQWVNDNASELLADRSTVPEAWLDAAAPMPKGFVWDAPGVNDPAALRAFAIGTCSGCHLSETGAPFMHVGRRFAPGTVAELSAYTVGGELTRRTDDLTELLSMTKRELRDVYRNRFRDRRSHAH